MTRLRPGGTIGIVGGGQLGRMSAIAAARLGLRVVVLSPEPDCPASHVATQILGDYEDRAALERFAHAVDVVTFEFENVSADALDLLASIVPVRPSPLVLRISQDRIAEKSFLREAGIATAPWAPVPDRDVFEQAVAALGTPAILKTTRGGYDGKGQILVREASDAAAAWSSLSASGPLVLEGFVDFAREISVIVARGEDGTTAWFDPVENRHRNGILDLTLAPAPVAPAIAEDAVRIAIRTAEALDLVGLLAVEMFVDRNGRVLVNEIAPRPHNSGHWTIEACLPDQFSMHIRAVAGLPLPVPERHADALMKNLVGPEEIADWDRLLARRDISLHHYGKMEARPGRKMAHATILFPRGALPGEFGISAALSL